MKIFIFGQGVFSAIVLIFTLISNIFGYLISWSKGKVKFKRVLTYLIVFCSVVGTISLNNLNTERQSKKLITAIQKYKTDKGNYPDDLKRLVPNYIPRAKYSTFGSFMYFSSKNGKDPEIMYVRFPPFLRKFINVESGSISYVD